MKTKDLMPVRAKITGVALTVRPAHSLAMRVMPHPFNGRHGFLLKGAVLVPERPMLKYVREGNACHIMLNAESIAVLGAALRRLDEDMVLSLEHSNHIAHADFKVLECRVTKAAEQGYTTLPDALPPGSLVLQLWVAAEVWQAFGEPAFAGFSAEGLFSCSTDTTKPGFLKRIWAGVQDMRYGTLRFSAAIEEDLKEDDVSTDVATEPESSSENSPEPDAMYKVSEDQISEELTEVETSANQDPTEPQRSEMDLLKDENAALRLRIKELERMPLITEVEDLSDVKIEEPDFANRVSLRLQKYLSKY